MNWWLIVEIILRMCFGLNIVGFCVGLVLCDKHKIFKDILGFTGFITLGFGVIYMLMYAIFGVRIA
jgi:hypothetical protein